MLKVEVYKIYMCLRVTNLYKNSCYSIITKKIYTSSILSKVNPNWGSTKPHRRVKLYYKLNAMTDPVVEKALAPLRTSVKEQGDFVRQLKATGAPVLDIQKAVAELKLKKKLLDDKELELMPATAYFDRAKMENLLKRRFFYHQSFSIYGGISGQYDFGPMGCALETNLLNLWRKFFILEEQMFEVRCSILTPESVLKTSGHVERFADLMVKDSKTGECFRLDHLIKSHLEKVIFDKKTSEEKRKECENIIIKLDGFNKKELEEIIIKYDIKSPITGNILTEPIEFNLMFATQIGPAGNIKGYLRPETAQGIFVNFQGLLEFNQGKLPFAAAQIGSSFRNEISPRSGLIRVREFVMAEIEHFCDPSDKSHAKFSSVTDLELTLYSACNQMDGKTTERITIGEAVKSGMVANETLGYFMARIYKFLKLIGIDDKRLRFRQHMSNEMAHYACDCWDAECLTSFGWIECVGCADRSAYDLTQHAKVTGVRLVVEKRLPEPTVVDITEIIPIKSIIGKEFKQKANIVCQELKNLSPSEVLTLQKQINEEGKYLINVDKEKFTITKDMIQIKSGPETRYVEEIIPNVIEPSFGIGRIMYALFEHSFQIREGEETRTYFSLSPIVAPLKCVVLPLSSKEEFMPLVKQISSDLLKLAVSHKIDDSAGSIGKRYTRSDEIAVPFGITIDFDSLKEPHTVTLRERDSTKQLRIPVSEIASTVQELTDGLLTWQQATEKYPVFEQQESTKLPECDKIK